MTTNILVMVYDEVPVIRPFYEIDPKDDVPFTPVVVLAFY